MNLITNNPTQNPSICRLKNSLLLLLLFAVFTSACATDSGRDLATPTTQPTTTTTVAPVDDTTSTTPTVDRSTTLPDNVTAVPTETEPAILDTDSSDDYPTTQPPATDTTTDTTTTVVVDGSTQTKPAQTTTIPVAATTTNPQNPATTAVVEEPHPDNTPYTLGDNGERIWEGDPSWCSDNRIKGSDICLFEGQYYCFEPDPDNRRGRLWGKILCENQEYHKQYFSLCSDVPADATQTATTSVRQFVTLVLSSGFWRVDLCLRDGKLTRDDPVWDKWRLTLHPGDLGDLHSPYDEHYFRWDGDWDDWTKVFFEDAEEQAKHCTSESVPTNFPFVFCGFGGDEDRQRIIYLSDEFPDNIFYTFHVEANCNPVAGSYVPRCGRYRVSFTPVSSQTG